jgi:hypothetical protein
MDYKIIADNIQHTGSLTEGYPDHITEISIILQGSFSHGGEQFSVEEHGQTGFSPSVSYSDIFPGVEEIAFQLAEANGWFSTIEEKENSILERVVRFRPEFSLSADGEKSIDTEAKYDRLAKATTKGEVLDVKGAERRGLRKVRDKKSISDRIAEKERKRLEEEALLAEPEPEPEENP